MSDYTPTTDEVRDGYAWFLGGHDNVFDPQGYEDFDRWLALHDAEVAAKALRDHAKRVAYWRRDRSPRAVTYSTRMIVADLEEYANRIEREAGIR